MEQEALRRPINPQEILLMKMAQLAEENNELELEVIHQYQLTKRINKKVKQYIKKLSYALDLQGFSISNLPLNFIQVNINQNNIEDLEVINEIQKIENELISQAQINNFREDQVDLFEQREESNHVMKLPEKVNFPNSEEFNQGQQIKRKPGRPAKNQLKIQGESQLIPPQQNPLDQQKVKKRGPGRPPKNQQQQQMANQNFKNPESLKQFQNFQQNQSMMQPQGDFQYSQLDQNPQLYLIQQYYNQQQMYQSPYAMQGQNINNQDQSSILKQRFVQSSVYMNQQQQLNQSMLLKQSQQLGHDANFKMLHQQNNMRNNHMTPKQFQTQKKNSLDDSQDF